MGKLKGKITTSGDSGMLSYKDETGRKIDVKYDQPFSAEVGIGVGTRVAFDVITTGEGVNIAVGVSPVNKGTIVDISYETGSGSLTETESGLKYPFTQNYLKESGFVLNQVVTYDLIYVKDSLRAVSLVAAAN